MPTKPTTPPPVTPPPPSLWPLLGQALLSLISSPFLKAVLTALLAGASGGFFASKSLPNFLPDFGLPSRPKLLPRPRKAEDAIGKIQFGNAGCTATIIGPVYSDDATLDILTAAHCVKIGATGKMTLKDGRVLTVKCVARDADSDAAWLTAAKPEGDVPYLELAEGLPNNGEVVWHQGYGIDKPANRESGIFKGTRGNGNQCTFRLSVSPGDSGGGIILDTASRVVSPVCCTTKLSGTGDVFGASPQAVAKIRPKRTTEVDEPILAYPVLPVPEDDFQWAPKETALVPKNHVGDK